MADALTVAQLERFLQDSGNEPRWRQEAAKAMAYFDGNQLDQDYLEKAADRGLPPLVRNLIGPTIRLVLGMEAKNRRDWQISAEGDADFDRAMALNALMKATERATKADAATSAAYASQVKVGLGWVEVGYESNPFLQPLRVAAVPYQEVYFDWRSRDPFLSDARFLVRHRWIDLDVAQLYFPGKRKLLEEAVRGWADWDQGRQDAFDDDLMGAYDDFRASSLETLEWLSVERDRVRLSEVWYRNYVRGKVMRLPDGSVLRYDESNANHRTAVAAGVVTVGDAVLPVVRLSWWAGPHRLIDIPSPYPHDAFPYVPFWAFREGETGIPYGLIRGMLSPQDEVNSRLARMYWLLSAKQVIGDADAAYKPWDEVVDEAGRPDALILMNPNRRNKDGRIEIKSDFQLGEQQFQVLRDATQAIQDTAGVYQSMLGKATAGADSGIAISSLVEQGATTLADLNDNYASARIRVGELLLALVVDRASGKPLPVSYEYNGEPRSYTFNAPGEPSNALSALLLRVGLVDVPDTPTYRMQQFKNLTEVLKSLPPELQMAVAHIVIRASDLPQKEEMARIIAQATGQGAPAPQTPEQSAQQAAQAQIAQQQADMQAQMAQLQIEEQTAKVEKLRAEADKIRHGAVLDEGKLALEQDKHGLEIVGRAMDAEREANQPKTEGKTNA